MKTAKMTEKETLEVPLKLKFDPDDVDADNAFAQLRMMSAARELFRACEEALPLLKAFEAIPSESQYTPSGDPIFSSEIRAAIDYTLYAILKATGRDTIHELLGMERDAGHPL